MKDRSQKAIERLREQGYRLTGVRKLVVHSILKLRGHWTIQEIEKKIKNEVPGLGTATLYRTVHLLAKEQILSETKIGRGAARYEVAGKSHHDHLTCLQCGLIVEFENASIEKLQKQIADRLGFHLADHRMELYGNCERSRCPQLK